MGDTNVEVKALIQAGYRYAFSHTQREPEAEDLVQEAWLKLYRNRGGDINRQLLFTTIRNLFIDQYRRKQRVSYELFEEEKLPVQTAPDLEREITGRELSAALVKLRDKEREAIFLNIVEGYTAKEISEMMKCPRGTVLSLINRGKQKLLNGLNRYRDRRQRIFDGLL